jgi:putative flavoprotein involved in K+ transport
MQSKTERYHTVVIGAGQAGLATGYYLAQHGVTDFAILESQERVGDSWRKRWDSLRLFTLASWSSLPGLPFPAPQKEYYPSKDEAADYLEQYATKFKLPVQLGVRVEQLTREGDVYVLRAGDRRIEAGNVVVAAGPFQKPRIPSFASELDPGITQLHSSAYRNPGQLKDGDVLVAGAACSGCEIAMELKGYHRDQLHKIRRGSQSNGMSRRVILAGPDVGREPPRIIMHTLAPFIMRQTRDTFLGKKIFNVVRKKGHPLVDFSYKDLKKVGVERAGRVIGAYKGKPQLEDGRVLDVANVIWATGYSIDFSWIDRPIFEEDGYPRHVRGVVEEEPGLYFVGLIFLYTISSQLWIGVPRDTTYIADALVRRSRQPAGETIGRMNGLSAAG